MGQCRVTASPQRAHTMARATPGLLRVVTAAPRAGASLLPGSGTGEAMALPAKPSWDSELAHPLGRSQR